jgi:hypothetical protein
MKAPDRRMAMLRRAHALFGPFVRIERGRVICRFSDGGHGWAMGRWTAPLAGGTTADGRALQALGYVEDATGFSSLSLSTHRRPEFRITTAGLKALGVWPDGAPE